MLRLPWRSAHAGAVAVISGANVNQKPNRQTLAGKKIGAGLHFARAKLDKCQEAETLG
jgi:hypothetical protein